MTDTQRLMVYTIKGFPVPPTTNQLYAYAPTYRRMVKTKVYREYDKAVQLWILGNQETVSKVRDFLKDLGLFVLDVSAVFHMEQKKIVCANGKPKRNDTSNRLKALHDVLSEVILGVDDSYFWSCSADKVPVAGVGHVEIVLRLRMINAKA
jgi:Holliday junction resolvase RusA-like endonuclease